MPDRQRSLFDDEPAAWEEDDQAEQVVATVVFSTGPPGEFDYLVPDSLLEQIEVGKRVRGPLGRADRVVGGYCVRVETRPRRGRRLKPLRTVVDDRSLLSPAMLRLTEWIAEHYLCSWAQVLDAVVPAGVRVGAGTRLTTFLALAPDAGARLREVRLPAKQAAVIKMLESVAEPMTPLALSRAAKCTQAPIMALRRKGLIATRMARLAVPGPLPVPVVRESHLTPNADQKGALDTILAAMDSREPRTILVHGVTGSGKTEVYIQAIQEVIRFGRQAIVLVPEISLTPQTVERFRLRFEHVAVLHSHLTDAERHRQWQQIADGRVHVVVGARSAIFAPTPNLGLIVLDEEHESSFKQATAPRYHARDVAIARSRMEKIPLVLGSATPSLESWHQARLGRYELVEMPRRVSSRPLPGVDTIDLRLQSHARFSRGSISRPLHNAIRVALEAGGQVILLLNRRGFSTHIQCSACGAVMRCPDCEIALTHHRTEQIALCHYCDYQVPAPSACPKCGFTGIRYSGLGTQRLEAEVKARFPEVPCLRMDTDSMQGRGSHQKALDAFRSGDVKILLGTQMIAKGLDFPNVTLVGVINADTALHLPDFRAAERTFQLVTQVAGRTGRGPKGGRVLVQTFSPEHFAIQAAAKHDYAAFAAAELPVREAFCYPPFASMIRLVVRGQKEQPTALLADQLAQRVSAALAEQGAEARVLGPAPAPFARLRGMYRFQIQVQGHQGDRLRAAVREATADVEPPKGIQWIVDVDPLDML